MSFNSDPSGSIYAPKTNARPLPPGAPVPNFWSDTDANQARQALFDLQAHSSGTVNIMEFAGGLPINDGAHDATSALQNAIFAAMAGNRDLVIPAGTYRVGAGGVRFGGRLHIIGQGQPVLVATDTDGKLLHSNTGGDVDPPVRDLLVRDLTFTTSVVDLGMGSLNWSLLTITNDVSGALVENCVFDSAQCRQAGLLVAPADSGDFITNFSVLNCHFTGMQNVATFFEGDFAPQHNTRIEFRGNTLRWNGLGPQDIAFGMGVSFAGQTRFLNCSDNIIEGFAEAGVEIAWRSGSVNPSDITLHGNQIDRCGFGIIFDSGGANSSRIDRISVVGNVIKDCLITQRFNFLRDSVVAGNTVTAKDTNFSPGRISARQVEMEFCDRVSVVGNVFDIDVPELSQDGVQISGWKSGSFVGNLIRSTGVSTLYMLDTAGNTEGNLFAGNQFVLDPQTTGDMPIRMTGAGVRQNTFIGNYFRTPTGLIYQSDSGATNNLAKDTLVYNPAQGRFLEYGVTARAVTTSPLDLSAEPDLSVINLAGAPTGSFDVLLPTGDTVYRINNKTGRNANVHISGGAGRTVPPSASVILRTSTGFTDFDDTAPILAAPGIPTEGNWSKGTRVINSSPSVGQPRGWICIATGVTGTWVPEGIVEASGVFSGTGISFTNTGTLTSNVADVGTAVGIILNNATTLAAAGARLLSVRNNGTEKSFIDLSGQLFIENIARFATSPLGIAGRVADGATAVGVKLGNASALTISGAKVATFCRDSFVTDVAAVGVSGSFSSSFSQNLTPGTSATLNTPAGRFVISNAQSAFTVTNSSVLNSSVVHVTVESNDTTAAPKNCTPAAGSFVFRTTANTTANTTCSFIVFNGN